jgi:glucose/arabinose dehydrogenase
MKYAYLLAFWIFAVAPLKAEPEFKELARFPDVIWSIEAFPDGKLWAATKAGQIFEWRAGTPGIRQVTGVPPVVVYGQGGLMDIKLHPGYPKNPELFLTATIKNGPRSWTTQLLKGTITPEGNLTGVQPLWTAKVDSKEGVHFGSRITFDTEGHLFVGIGDRGQRDRAQDLSWHQGKVIRLKLDGSVPANNPFVGREGALPEIWSYGHRNPQGLFYDVATKTLWSNEHGPRGGDELNRVEPAKNYGWPVITYGREYWGPSIGEGKVKEGMEQPEFQWTPSIAPSSLLVYSGKKHTGLKGSFLSGALVLQHLNHLTRDKDGKLQEERFFTSLGERIRSLEEGPDGSLFLGTDSGRLGILKMSKN